MFQNIKTHSLTTPREDSLRTCRHCHSQLDSNLADDFCCHGCRSAYKLIEQLDLKKFYQIVRGSEQNIKVASPHRSDYTLFDAADYQKKFVESDEQGQSLAHFYLDNMSCYACVWVCEQVTRQLDANAKLTFNMSSGAAELTFDPSKVPLSDFLRKFEILGYTVSPNSDFQENSTMEIARIGVAIFCLMNIMMLAFPEYLGAETLSAEFRNLFRWISTLLAAVSVFFSGWPFLLGAVTSLREFRLHLDLPIGLALFVCFFYSLAHTIQGHPHVYYDSTAAVVALLLVGRWAQKKALQTIMREQARFFSSETRFVRRLKVDGQEEVINLQKLDVGQELRIPSGEVIPLKVELLSPFAEIDRSLLTGESAWQAVQQGSVIEAGAVNGGTPIIVRSLETGIQSFLLKLQSAAQSMHQQKGSFASLSESMARAFVLFVLTMAGATLAWNWPISHEQAITRFATVLLIACPCIFGFGAPMVISRALVLGLQRGILFKTQHALERLSQVRNFFFDKTGTLTEDQSFVSQAQWNEKQMTELGLKRDMLLPLFRSLPELSKHHCLAAIADFAGTGERLSEPIRQLYEVFGQGISFEWRQYKIRIGRYGFCFREPATLVESLEFTYVSVDRKNILQFKLQDHLRPDAERLIRNLKASGKSVFILTGDSEEKAQKVGSQLGIGSQHILAHLSPEQKLEQISGHSHNAMVGNGINDTLAMAKVEIGIAVENSTTSLREKADISLLDPGLDPLGRAIALSQATRSALQRCFGFALLFNLIGMTLAITGWATPVLGAILMPISSFTVFALARRWK